MATTHSNMRSCMVPSAGTYFLVRQIHHKKIELFAFERYSLLSCCFYMNTNAATNINYMYEQNNMSGFTHSQAQSQNRLHVLKGCFKKMFTRQHQMLNFSCFEKH